MLTATVQMIVLFSSIFFQDNFNDGNADGWYTVGPSTYLVSEGRYHFSGGGAVNDATSYRGDSGEEMSCPDYSITADVEIDVGYSGGVMLRYSENGEYNMMLVLCPVHQSLILYRWYWNSIEWVDSYSYPFETGTEYRLRMQCDGNTFTGRVWLPEEDEPDQWFVSATDTVSRNGSATLFSAGVSKNPADVYMSCFFDNVVVESPETWSLTNVTWAGIKKLNSSQ